MVRGVGRGNFGGNSECSNTMAVGKGDGNWSHCFNCADCAPQRPLGTTGQLTHLLLPYAHYCTLSSIRRSLLVRLLSVLDLQRPSLSQQAVRGRQHHADATRCRRGLPAVQPCAADHAAALARDLLEAGPSPAAELVRERVGVP